MCKPSAANLRLRTARAAVSHLLLVESRAPLASHVWQLAGGC
jgi:hypothetical protein